MPIVAQYLFGSHARRDFTEGSDIDLLSVISEERFATFSEGKLNVSLYPMPKFIEAASRGDLFVMHIVREAIVVYDPTQFHRRLIDRFVPKSSYHHEIKQASDLGWYLVESGDQFRNQKTWNKRVAWCARTILIARSAEKGDPIFSAEKLANTVDFSETLLLLGRKSEVDFDFRTAQILAKFLTIYGTPAPGDVVTKDAKKAWWYFQKHSNRVALSTIDSVVESVSKDIYGN